mmetsp:Transcript_37671/g.82389  ORF Transcript_37671/g.82389 Transcript_37671/m.82389 type:complete len:448 (-) Transcript_37671:115-1458(-)
MPKYVSPGPPKEAVEAFKRRNSTKKPVPLHKRHEVVIGGVMAATFLAIFVYVYDAYQTRINDPANRVYKLINSDEIVHGAQSASDGNFTTAASPVFNGWTLMDIKSWGGVGTNPSMVGMPGAAKYCELPEDDVESGAIPSNFDSREAFPGCINEEVYNSNLNGNNCTSSYALAAASSMAYRWCVADEANNANLRLSPQQIVNCDKGSRGCSGGGIDAVFAYIEKRGLYPESCLPYTGVKDKCKKDSITCDESQKRKAISHCILTKGGKQLQREIMNNGPVVVPMHLHEEFLVYKSGVFAPIPFKDMLRNFRGDYLLHAVVVVGWGRGDQGKYWIIENSWGKEWGEDGFARVHESALMTNYAVVGYPATPAAVAAQEAARAAAKERLEQAKKERAEREAQRAAAAAAARAADEASSEPDPAMDNLLADLEDDDDLEEDLDKPDEKDDL